MTSPSEVPTVQQLAREALSWFYYTGKDHPTMRDEIWATREGHPEWVQDLCFAAHSDGDMLPDDWRYEFIVDALQRIADSPDRRSLRNPELEPPIYTSELTDWLGSGYGRTDLVDQAISDHGKGDYLDEDIQRGMLIEMDEVYAQVLEFLDTRQEELEQEADAEEEDANVDDSPF